MIKFEKNLHLSSSILNTIYFTIITNVKFFVKSTTSCKLFYLKVPNSVSWKMRTNKFIFWSNFYNDLSNFFNLFLIFLKKNNNVVKKKLLLKGLGFRVSFSEDKSKLILKLGYSHLIEINIPNKNFHINLQKNSLILQGEDSILLGNFCNVLRNLKPADSYKGKGFSFRNQKIQLKPVKKK